MADPRISIIEERLRNIKHIIAVSSGKGGVGKSLVASILALILARKGFNVGLFDLDFTSPSTHLILGVEGLMPEEDKGVVPPLTNGIKYMSITYYSGENVSPLRGSDISNALIELLAITRWNSLDYLIIDMPPGISDSTLDLLRLVRRVKFLIVTSPSKLAFETVRKLIALLREMNFPIIGLIENMDMKGSPYIREMAERLRINYLGSIPFDFALEDALGDVNALLKTKFSESLMKIVDEIYN
ncbi:MAG: Mrp/NBP35 family ATP-binding protein [archaeon GB-1867-097]|nr:Mrp/NBP35 family ATP-binding protein [Candidatus Culexmicrobium thermophilum]